MIITCPSCESRYDVEEGSFLPDGRSVRCAECETSWYVPAPEPVEALSLKTRVAPTREGARHGGAARDGAQRGGSAREDARSPDPDRDSPQSMFADDGEEAAPGSRGRFRPDWRKEWRDANRDRGHADDDGRERPEPRRSMHGGEDDGRDDGPDDGRSEGRLPPRDRKGRFVPRSERESAGYRSDAAADVDDRDHAGGRGRSERTAGASYGSGHGGQQRTNARSPESERTTRRARFHIEVEESDADDDVLFPRRPDPRSGDGDGRKGARRDQTDADRPRNSRERVDGSAGRDRILDADFEDVRPGGHDDRNRDFSGFVRASRASVDRGDEPGFDARSDDDFHLTEEDRASPGEAGRRLRNERRRATALMKIDDLDPIAERVFNDEFFAALNVQPRELEKAIRKARRRAEARDKNRMTPMKALGWSMWAGAIAATVFVGYAYRNQIVLRFPGASRAYDVVGLAAAPFGVTIEQVSQRVAMSTGGPTIEITGVLRNAIGHDVVAPVLMAQALSSGGEVLETWTFEADASRVGAGSDVPFRTRRAAPIGVVEVSLSFARAQTGAGDL